jgi:hypothetical protein
MSESGMRLLDRIKSASAPKAPRCSIGAALLSLGKQDSADLKSALEDHTIFGTTIEEVLKSEGIKVGQGAVNRHRKHKCNCE